MTEVTGLVLTIGEETTERAISSLKQQTIPPQDIIVIENVSPFHRAINVGWTRVKTPFFIQCDADMVLDPDCLETMLPSMTDGKSTISGNGGRPPSMPLRDQGIMRKKPLSKHGKPCTAFRTQK